MYFYRSSYFVYQANQSFTLNVKLIIFSTMEARPEENGGDDIGWCDSTVGVRSGDFQDDTPREPVEENDPKGPKGTTRQKSLRSCDYHSSCRN
jgi:hypothetical protein